MPDKIEYYQKLWLMGSSIRKIRVHGIIRHYKVENKYNIGILSTSTN